MTYWKQAIRWLYVAALLGAVVVPHSSGLGQTTEDEEKGKMTEWAYAGDVGPAHWGKMQPDYAACGGGFRQSPIDLTKPIFVSIPDWMGLRYGGQIALANTIVNTGTGMHIETGDGHFLVVRGEPFELYRIEFHRPSEHTVDGKVFPMEMQFYHRNEEGRRVAVAIFMERDRSDNPSLAEIWRVLPVSAGSRSSNRAGGFDPRLLMPIDRSGWRYYGSMTQPPCAEDVLWYIMTEPTTVSQRQLERFRVAMPTRNARPVVPLGERFMLFSE